MTPTMYVIAGSAITVASIVLAALTLSWALHNRAACRVCQQRDAVEKARQDELFRRHANEAMWTARRSGWVDEP